VNWKPIYDLLATGGGVPALLTGAAGAFVASYLGWKDVWVGAVIGAALVVAWQLLEAFNKHERQRRAMQHISLPVHSSTTEKAPDEERQPTPQIASTVDRTTNKRARPMTLEQVIAEAETELGPRVASPRTPATQSTMLWIPRPRLRKRS
jgi:hypothetical protein